MNSATPLDYALLQLSPRGSRCELFVYGDGKTEKLASGSFKPFASHLRAAADERAAQAARFMRLEVENPMNGGAWFNKDTLERFVQFVNTPEVLEMVSAIDAEVAQLEVAKKIYSQGDSEQLAGTSVAKETDSAEATDTTKNELLKAIDMRLVTVKQNLIMACSHAFEVGFNLDNVTELLLFADCFSAQRLNDACTKFISLCKRRPEILSHQTKVSEDKNARSSSESDMSIDEPEKEASVPTKPFHKRSVSCSGQLHESTPASSNVSVLLKQTKPMLHRSVEGEAEKATGPPIPAVASAEPTPATGASGSRPLSVQDKINLFESKQKDSSSVAAAAAGGISRTGVGRAELRRFPSDCSAEKSVLRRWSGASDMSIDLGNNDEKDGTSAVMTPSTSTNFHFQTSSKTEVIDARLKDTETMLSSLPARKDDLSRTPSPLSFKDGDMGAKFEEQKFSSDVMSNHGSESEVLGPQKQPVVLLNGMEYVDLNKSADSEMITEAIVNPTPLDTSDYQATHQTQFEAVIHGNTGVHEWRRMQMPSYSVSALTEVKEDFTLLPRLLPVSDVGGERSGNSTKAPHPKLLSRVEVRNKLKGPPNSNVQIKPEIALKGDMAIPESIPKSFSPTSVDLARKEAAPRTAQTKELIGNVDSANMKLHVQAYSPDQNSNIHRRQVEKRANNTPVLKGVKVKNIEIVNPPPPKSPELVNMVRPSKRNQELNDELQMKANELEKLFAAHKLRTNGEQMDSSGINQTVGSQSNHVEKTVKEKSSETLSDQFPDKKCTSESTDNGVDFVANLLTSANSKELVNNVNNILLNLGPSEDLRGKFYDKYMQKRDTKQREEWLSNRVHREAELKAMHDSLERSKAEMRAKFAGSSNKQDACYRAEKMKPSNYHLSSDIKCQTIDVYRDVDDDLQEISEQVHSDALFSNGSSHVPPKKLPTVKSIPSSTPRIPIGQVTSSSVKAPNSGSFRRNAQAENPLAQSVPIFSDVKKENTRSSSKINSRNSKITRSRSIKEEIASVREDLPRRTQSMRKSLAMPSESKDVSHLNLDNDIVSTSQRGSDSKSFLRKGNGVGPGSGAAIARVRLQHREGSERFELTSGIVRDLDEGFEREFTEGHSKVLDFSVDSESENPTLSPESRYSREPVFEASDSSELPSQADDSQAITCSKFNASARIAEDSPAESPRSWSTRHPVSFAHEASDVDASVDSPTGSQASWTSRPLNHMIEVDAARMRKKWGSSQVPVLATNVSHQQRKDQTKGFKRLLKFGRKNKGSESLLSDCVSVSTASEGDEDTEDGREVGRRSSDDSRKTRMGHPASLYNEFIDGDVFHEQDYSSRGSVATTPSNFRQRGDQFPGSPLKAPTTPHSFFSLSSLRSKGAAESRPR